MKYLKKTVIVFVLLLLFITGLVFYINSSKFTQNVQEVIKSLNLNLKVGDAKFVGFGKIKVTDLTLYDKEGNPAIEAKEAYVYINPLSITRVRKIDVYSPNIILEKYKNLKFNITEMFASDSNKIDRTSRIGRINFYNANLDYRDKSYEKLIQKDLSNVNGYVSFSKSKGISLEAKGSSGDEKVGVILKVIYPPKNPIRKFFKKPVNDKNIVYLKLDFDNLRLFQEAGQYVPFNGLDIYDGRLTGFLELGEDKKFSGNLEVKNGTIKYVDYDDILKNVNTKVVLKSNNVDVDAVAAINGGNLDLGIKFLEKTKTVKLDIKADNMNYSDIKKYRIVKDFNVPAEGRVTGIFKGNLNLTDKIYEFDGTMASPRIKYADYYFNNLKTDFIYNKSGILELKNMSFRFDQAVSNVYINANATGVLTFDTKKKEGQGNYELDNINSDFSVKKIYGSINIDKNTVVSSNFTSNELDGNFIFDTKNRTMEVSTNSKEFFDLKYGENKFTLKPTIRNLKMKLDKFILVSGLADIELAKSEYYDSVKLSANVKNSNFDVNAVVGISGQQIKAVGVTDSKFNHKYVVTGSNVNLKPILQRFGVKLAGIEDASVVTDLHANIYSMDGKIKGDFKLDSRRGKYFAEYEKLSVSGNIENLLSGKLQAKVDVGELWINYQRFKNLSGSVHFENSVFTVNNLKNEDLNINLAYNVKAQTVNLSAVLQNYVVYNVATPEFNLYVNQMNVNLSGKVDSLNGTINIAPSMISIDNRNIGDLKGNILVNNSVLYFNEVTLRNNRVAGTYDLNAQNADLLVHIDEQNAEDLYGISDLKLSVNSDLRIQGKLDNFNIMGTLNVGHLSYGEFKLPNIESEIVYKNGDINKLLKKGSLDIPKFILRGEEGEEILNTKGKVDDLATSQLNFVVDNKQLDLGSIKGLKDKGYSGIINYSFILRGNIDDFFVDLKADSKDFSVSGFKFNNLSIDTQVNNKGLNIGQFYLEYENNPLLVNGYATFKPVDYNISVIAENFNLDFLKAGEGIADAGGIINLDVTFTPQNTTGKIKIDNFVFKDKKGTVDLSNLNADVDIVNRKLVIKDITQMVKDVPMVTGISGNYNGGTFNITGDLDVPGIAPDFAETKRIDLGDFDLKIVLDKVNIKYGKLFDGIVSTNLNFTEKELTGNVDIEKGSINDVSQFLDKEQKEEKPKKDLSIIDGLQAEIVDIIMGQYSARIELNIIKGVDLNISSASVIRSIKGVVRGGARITYNSGGISADGSFDVIKGSFSLNDRKFSLDRAEIRYGNNGFTGSSISNPFVILLATTYINNDQISISMNGELSDPQIKFNSTLGLTQEQILALLLFDASAPDNTDFRQDEQNEQLGNILDTGLNQLIFNPVIDRIEETFGFTSVEVKANLLQNNNGNSKDTSMSTVEPSIYIQDSLYKDKFYWNVRLTYDEDQSSAGLDYNFWVTYKVSPKFGVNLGVQNLRTRDTALETTDYYLGVEFSTRFSDFGEFINSLKKPKLEVITNQEN